MGEFFHGWKRNIGLVTLLMACVLAVGWVRSLYFTDQLCFRMVNEETLQSVNGSLLWWRDTRPPNPASIPEIWLTRPLDGWDLNDGSDLNWKFGLIGFVHESVVTLRVIRYRSVVVPSTAISAFLLLSKPRSSIQKNSNESIPKTVS
jgi:hypothetical protein